MKQHLVALAAGFVFAVGLGVSGMTDPHKVIAFLDVTGAWDPSLAFVMMGAIAVHAVAAMFARRRSRPFVAEAFVLPKQQRIDRRLLVGAALFGAGWGAAGFCPGPALVSLVGLSSNAFAFVIAMVFGMALFRWMPALASRATRRDARALCSDG